MMNMKLQKITNSITSELNSDNNKNIDNNNNEKILNNNIIIEPYINSIKSAEKKLKNIDNNIINSHSAKKESTETPPDILKNNKFSNINYDQVFNISDTEKTKIINRVVKTENNQSEEYKSWENYKNN